jgi:RNA polymerase sigma-B factor
LRMRYIEEMTQSQIAKRIGVSQMQVSRLLRRSLDALRELTAAAPTED